MRACAEPSAAAMRAPRTSVSATVSVPRCRRFASVSPSIHCIARNGSPVGEDAVRDVAHGAGVADLGERGRLAREALGVLARRVQHLQRDELRR